MSQEFVTITRPEDAPHYEAHRDSDNLRVALSNNYDRLVGLCHADGYLVRGVDPEPKPESDPEPKPESDPENGGDNASIPV